MPRRILVIDDSPLILAATRSALEGAGYDVATVATLEAFEEERQHRPPDLIVVDIQMPEIFGDDLASTLREAYEEQAPILLLSSLEEDELARRAEESGARGWVSKRSGMSALIAKITEVIGSSETSS